MISRRLVLKVVGVLSVITLAIPLILNYLANKESEKFNHQIKNIIDLHDFGYLNIPPMKDHKDFVKNSFPKEDSIQFLHAEKRQRFDPPVFTKNILGNYEVKQPGRTGPGENGQPVILPSGHQGDVDLGFSDMGFNKVVSEMISLNRSVLDTRHPECRYWNYALKLPTASVVIIFLNEGWTTLLRTVHSVYNRSPPHLLKEIILLDDFSEKDFLGKPLVEYVKRFRGKVKVVRNSKREGLIRARVNGARRAVGDVLIFLDSHCEVNTNWLPPLLAPILSNRRTLAVPIVDGIDDNTFEYRPVYTALHRGIFEWGFLYKEIELPYSELRHRNQYTSPYRSPTHAGGLFAINRKYFFELGAYDPFLETWGGENYELSFKLWQCGGEQVWVPCSHVGHIYSVRGGKPYSISNVYQGISNTDMNYLRVVEVWFDPEYKEYFYTRQPQLRGCPVRNIAAQLKFKRDHNCKNFRWFMDNVAYDVFRNFPAPPRNRISGQFMMKAGNFSHCWDTGPSHPVLFECHEENYVSINQIFRLNIKGQIGNGERCIEATRSSNLKLVWCTLGDVSGPWMTDSTSHLIHHMSLDQCVAGRGNDLVMTNCDPADEHQQWFSREAYSWKLDFPR